MKLCIILVLATLQWSAFGQHLEWVKAGSTEEPATLTIFDLQYHDNHLYLSGKSNSDLWVGNQEYSLDEEGSLNFISKYSLSGELQWLRKAPGQYHPIFSVDQAGNMYYANLTEFQENRLIKYAPNGEVVWEKSLSDDVVIRSMLSDKNGDLIIAGTIFHTEGSQILDQTIGATFGSHLFILKADGDGHVKWFRYSQPTHHDNWTYEMESGIRSISLNGNDDIFFIGDFVITENDYLTFDGLQARSGVYGASGPRRDIIIGKLDADGNAQWLRSFDSPKDDFGYKIVTAPDGNSYFTGMFTDSIRVDNTYHYAKGKKYSEILFGKISTENQIQWLKTGGGPYGDEISGYDAGYAVCVSDSYVYFGGTFFKRAEFGDVHVSAVNEKTHAFLTRSDLDGNFEWVAYEDKGTSEIRSLVARDDNVYFAGVYRILQAGGKVQFNGEDLPVVFPTKMEGQLLTAPTHFMVGLVGPSPEIVNGVEDKNGRESIYPNPTNGVFHVRKDVKGGPGRLTIYNAMGKVVYECDYLWQSEDTEIDATSLPSGVYTIRMEGQPATITRLVKQ